MRWKKYLMTLSLLLLGYLIVDYFGLISDYWEFILLLPLPTNIKQTIRYIRNYYRGEPITYRGLDGDIDRDIGFSKKTRRVTGLHKKMVASNQHWKCNRCKHTLDYTYEVDHIKPLYQGGTNDLHNLQALCRNCHGRKTAEDTLR